MMNEEKLKLVIELAKENPNIDTDKLLKLISIGPKEKEKEKNKDEKVWTFGEENTLIYFHNKGNESNEIAKKMGVDIRFVVEKKSELFKKGRIKTINKKMKYSPYSKEENLLVANVLAEYGEPKNVPSSKKEELAELLNRTPAAIYTKMHNIKNSQS